MWCKALKLVPAKFRGEFCRFVEEGEASGEFMAFLDQNGECRRACEIAFRADTEIRDVIAAAMEAPEEARALQAVHPAVDNR